jgi:hypothetical protein
LEEILQGYAATPPPIYFISNVLDEYGKPETDKDGLEIFKHTFGKHREDPQTICKNILFLEYWSRDGYLYF